MSHFCWYLFFSTTILRKNLRLLRASDLDCRNRMLTTWPPPRPNKDDFWIVLFAIVTYDKNLPWSDCGSVPCWSCWQAPGLVSRSNTGASSGLFSVRQEQQHGTSRLQRMIFMKGWKTSLVVKRDSGRLTLSSTSRTSTPSRTSASGTKTSVCSGRPLLLNGFNFWPLALWSNWKKRFSFTKIVIYVGGSPGLVVKEGDS